MSDFSPYSWRSIESFRCSNSIPGHQFRLIGWSCDLAFSAKRSAFHFTSQADSLSTSSLLALALCQSFIATLQSCNAKFD